MLCSKCKKSEMVETTGNYHYRESGLSNVVLHNIPMYKCSGCSHKVPRILNISGVHAEIARRVLAKESTLEPDEIRFLRKELRLKEVELANYLGVDKVTVSRWETSASRIDPAYDKLFRLFFLYKQTGAELPIPSATFLGRIRGTVRKSAARKHSNAEIKIEGGLLPSGTLATLGFAR